MLHYIFHDFAACGSLFNQIRNMCGVRTIHSRSGFSKPKELQTRRGELGLMQYFLNTVVPQSSSIKNNQNMWIHPCKGTFCFEISVTWPDLVSRGSRFMQCCNLLFTGISVICVSIRHSMLVHHPNRRETCAFGENILIFTTCLLWMLLMWICFVKLTARRNGTKMS